MDEQAAADAEAAKIRQQMEDTRAALTDKLAVLEQQVTGTVETVKDSVNAVKNSFDVKRHVRKRPWTLVAGATALGLFVGHRSSVRRARRQREAIQGGHELGYAPRERGVAARVVGGAFEKEISALKGVALGALFGLVRDMALRSVPVPAERRVEEVIDGITVKLGGRTLHSNATPRDKHDELPEVVGHEKDRRGQA